MQATAASTEATHLARLFEALLKGVKTGFAAQCVVLRKQLKYARHCISSNNYGHAEGDPLAAAFACSCLRRWIGSYQPGFLRLELQVHQQNGQICRRFATSLAEPGDPVADPVAERNARR